MGTTVTTGAGVPLDRAGLRTAVSAAQAHAEGQATSASAAQAHAEGLSTTASGAQAHAEGSSTLANSPYAHAEGLSTQAANSSAHAEGENSQANGYCAHAEGFDTRADGDYSHSQGYLSQATAQASHAEGYQSVASGFGSHAEGVYAVASRYGQRAKSSQRFAVAGDAQVSGFSVSCATSNATPKQLTMDQSGSGTAILTGATTNVLTIPVSRAHKIRVSVVARRSDVAGDAAGWEFSGVIVRGSSGNAAFVGTVDGRAWGTAGAAAWDVTPTIDTTDATNNYLKITATGEAGKTIRWVGHIEAVEVG